MAGPVFLNKDNLFLVLPLVAVCVVYVSVTSQFLVSAPFTLKKYPQNRQSPPSLQ